MLEPGWVQTQDAPPPTVHAFTEPTGPTDRLPPNSEAAVLFDQQDKTVPSTFIVTGSTTRKGSAR